METDGQLFTIRGFAFCMLNNYKIINACRILNSIVARKFIYWMIGVTNSRGLWGQNKVADFYSIVSKILINY